MKKKGTAAFFLAFLLFFSSPQVSFGETVTEYDSLLEPIAEKYVGKSVPGACVIISEKGRIVFSGGYGFARLEDRKPMDPENTVFEWGSLSKTFVWVSVMQLAEKGKIDLKQDIRTYLPDGFLRSLRYPEPVTMLHLMNHTAGFEEQLTDLRYYSRTEEQSLHEVMFFRQPEQVFPPGEISAYSNWGAALAALIVERISGQEYREYVKEHILTPLGMRNTSQGPFWNDVPGLLGKKAEGYSFSGKGFRKEDEMHLRMYPAGAMNGTAADLLLFAGELAAGPEKKSLLFDRPETKRQLFEETFRSFGANAGLSHGFWQYAGNNGFFGHEGGTYGFKTQFWVEPETERAVLIMTNVMETEFCSEVMEALTEKPRAGAEPEKTPPAAGDGAAAGKLLPEEKIPEGDFLPARAVRTNAGRIQGKMQILSVRKEDDGRLRIKMPFGGKTRYYEKVSPYRFFCADAPPEEQMIAFAMEKGVCRSMSFRLAHDYVPAGGTEGAAAALAALILYGAGTLMLAAMLLREAVVLFRKKRKIRWYRLVPLLAGIVFGGSAAAGLIRWFSVYSVISGELNAIVAAGRICGVLGFSGGAYGCFRERKAGAAARLLVFCLQFAAMGYMGFLIAV